MGTSRRILLNVTTRWIATLVQGALGIFLVRFLLFQLGQDGYGLAALMSAVVSMAMVADLGLGGALARHLAAQMALKDQLRFNQLASSAFLFYLVVGVTMGTACGVFASWITHAINAPPALESEALFLVRWYAAPALFLSFVTPVYVGVITSANRFDLLNCITVGVGIARATGLFLILNLTTTGLRGWAMVMLMVQALNLVITVWFAYRICPQLRITPTLATKTAFLILLSTGGYLFALQLANLLSIKADPIILSTFLGPAAVASYTPAVTLVGAVRPLITALADQLHPLATAYHEAGQRKNLGEVLIRGTKLTLLLGVGACVLLAVFAEPITRIWLAQSLGTQYVVTAQVLILWAAVDLLSYAAGSQWAVLLGTNRLRFLTWTQLPFAIVNVGASIALVGFTSLGVIGVMIPTFIIALVRRPIIIVHTARICAVPVGFYLREAYLRPMVIFAILTGTAAIVRLLARPSSMFSLLGWGAALWLLFLGLCWWVGLTKSERAMILSMLSLGTRRVTW